MFVPVPPQPNPPQSTPAEETDLAALPDDEPDDEADDAPLPPLHRAAQWPAVVRWARLCRVLAFVGLLICGLLTARNLYLAVFDEPQFGAFLAPPLTPATYLGYALACALLGITSCIGLLGFAELLHVILSIEAAAHRRSN